MTEFFNEHIRLNEGWIHTFAGITTPPSYPRNRASREIHATELRTRFE